MYKEIIIALLIVILIFVLDYITQKYTDIAINDAIQDLNNIKQILSNKEELDNNVVSDEINEKYQKWLEYHKKLAFYIEHNELEKVETNFVTGKSFIENAKYEEAMAELEKTVFILQHINDKYSVNLENFF